MTRSGESFIIERARVEDIELLLRLYRLVYGDTYPIRYGTDPEAAKEMILSQDDRWYIARDPKTGNPVASVIFDIDVEVKLGRVIALVVHPDYRNHGLARKLVEKGSDELLRDGGPINSLYATTRSVSIGPQLVFIRTGFLSLGIFPNAHKLKQYETLTLFARFRDGTLERRKRIEWAPQDLENILSIVEKRTEITMSMRYMAAKPFDDSRREPLAFEFIHAPSFVSRKFAETFKDPYDRFYPFHEPNFFMASTNGEVEIYASFNPKDRYCAIITVNVPVHTLHGRLAGLIDQLKDAGVSYIELLLGLEHGRSIEAALDSGFIPSAVYPAMRESEEGETEDFILLSRSFEPLNFKGMEIDESFRPFIDQYLTLWKKNAIESLEVYHEHR